MTKFPGFPHSGYPEGWFAIGWPDEFPVGSVTSKHYFGKDFTIFRTESGRLAVTAGFCPHMGAKLSVGGRIEGECIVCPFHAWRWDADGNNASIPYSTKALQNAKLKTYHASEIGNIVWLWYSWRSETPTAPAPELEFLNDDKFYWDSNNSRRLWSNIKLVPQLVAENIVDGPHIEYVHLSAESGHISKIEESDHIFTVEVDQTFMTRSGPFQGKTVTQTLGVGTQISDMAFSTYRVVNVLSTIPVDEDHCDMRASIFIQLPPGMEKPQSANDLPAKFQKLIKSHLDSQEQDLPIWEAMEYVAHPLLVAEEVVGHRKLRSWAKKFYADSAKTTV